MAKAKVPASRGFYLFEDGVEIWFAGLSGTEKRIRVRQHGKIVRFIHTN